MAGRKEDKPDVTPPGLLKPKTQYSRYAEFPMDDQGNMATVTVAEVEAVTGVPGGTESTVYLRSGAQIAVMADYVEVTGDLRLEERDEDEAASAPLVE